MIKRQVFPDEIAKIRRWARKANPNITFGYRLPDGSTHSLREMDNDDIGFVDLLRVLRNAIVTEARFTNNEMRYQVEGSDSDARELVFIVTLSDPEEEIEVVTAWAKDRRS